MLILRNGVVVGVDVGAAHSMRIDAQHGPMNANIAKMRELND
jgi:hypothetical protein